MHTTKKILIISDVIGNILYSNIQKHSVNQIFRTSYKSLNFSFNKKKIDIFDRVNNCSLDQYDLVYFKQYRIENSACVIFLQNKGIPFLNSDIGSNFIFDKLAQYMKLGTGGFLIPDSFYTSHKEMKKIGAEFTYPLILKSITSSLGTDNFLITNYVQLCETLDLHPKVPFITQEFIPNTYDYRVLVLGGKSVAVLKRTRRDNSDHRNNIALGADEQHILSPDPVLIDLSDKVAFHLNKDVAGVDAMPDARTGNYVIIEVNSKPSFTYDTNVSPEVPEFAKFIDGLVN